jgi:hypothetical protein
MGTHTFTPKSIGDPVSLFDPNDTFVRVSTVEGSGNGYYVVDGMYFTSGAGNGRGSLEAGWAIADLEAGDQDRSDALATLQTVTGVRWADMTTADLQSVVTLINSYILPDLGG